jgi:hypothetical protein
MAADGESHFLFEGLRLLKRISFNLVSFYLRCVGGIFVYCGV